MSGSSEYAARARAWQLIAAPGLAEGYNNLADAYETAGRYNRADSAAFREQVRLARAAASQLTLQAGETFRRFLDSGQKSNRHTRLRLPAGRSTAAATDGEAQ